MKKVLSLFEGRHNMPDRVEGGVFYNIKNPNDLNLLMKQCHNSLYDCDELELYVTGLTTALCTVINYCEYNGIPLTLMHHDKDTDIFITQKIYNPILDQENKDSNKNENTSINT